MPVNLKVFFNLTGGLNFGEYYTIIVFGQDANIEKTYGGIPTANANMNWEENLTPNEKYIGVIL